MTGSRVRRVADMGFPQIGYQAFKLLAHQRLHEAVRVWQEKYPGVDIILIEPDPNDELMFDTNIMNFTRRRGHRAARLRVGHAPAREGLRPRCARSARGTASRSPPRACARSSSTSSARRSRRRAWRRILEQTTGALLGSRKTPGLIHASRGAVGRSVLGRAVLNACDGVAQGAQQAPRLRRRCGSRRARGRRLRAGRRGATMHGFSSSRAASSAPVSPGGVQPDEVGLALGCVDREVVQLAAAPVRCSSTILRRFAIVASPMSARN